MCLKVLFLSLNGAFEPFFFFLEFWLESAGLALIQLDCFGSFGRYRLIRPELGSGVACASGSGITRALPHRAVLDMGAAPIFPRPCILDCYNSPNHI